MGMAMEIETHPRSVEKNEATEELSQALLHLQQAAQATPHWHQSSPKIQFAITTALEARRLSRATLPLLCFFVVQLLTLPVSGQVAAKVGPGKSIPYPARLYPAVVQHNHPASPLLYEDFENATGYDLAGWGENVGPGGVINEDYTATVLYQTQSLRVSTANDDAVFTTNSFTAQDRVFVFFLYRPLDIPASSSGKSIIRLTDSTENCQTKLTINEDGQTFLYAACGGTPASPALFLTINTTYYIWIEYDNDNGVNAYASIGISTTGVRPTTGDNFAEATATTTATQVSRVLIGNTADENPIAADMDSVYDHLLVDDAQIGDWP